MIVTTVYVPPSANAREAEDILSSHAHDVDTSAQDAAKLVTGDFNHCDLKKTLPRYEQIIVQELCESSRWPSWAVRPNEPSGFHGHKAILNHASALVSACP